MNYSSAVAGFSFYTTGIYRTRGHWFITGMDSPTFRRPGDRIELSLDDGQLLNLFVQELIENTEKHVYPQLVFRTLADLRDFLLLTDPRLARLQKHVARVRQTRNTLVCTADEVQQLMHNTKPIMWFNWFLELLSLEAPTHKLIVPPLQFLAAPMFSNIPIIEDDELDSAKIDFQLNRFLHSSHTVITALTGEHPGGIRVEAGAQIYNQLRNTYAGEFDGVVFVPDSPDIHPGTVFDLDDLAAIGQPGVVVPIEAVHVMPAFPAERNTVNRVIPFDVTVANKEQL